MIDTTTPSSSVVGGQHNLLSSFIESEEDAPRIKLEIASNFESEEFASNNEKRCPISSAIPKQTKPEENYGNYFCLIMR